MAENVGFEKVIAVSYYTSHEMTSFHFSMDQLYKRVAMLLMSWAGEQARKDLMLAMGRDLAAETTGVVTKMLDYGVEHRDVRPPNVLWNTEGRKVILVDFERSEILKQISILQEISPNQKRKHLYSSNGTSCSSGPPYQRFIDCIGYQPKTFADRHTSSWE
jgi:hypothetical protein